MGEAVSGLWLSDPGNACLQWGPVVKALMEGQKWPQPLLYDAQFAMERVYLGQWQLWLGFATGEEPSIMMLTWVHLYPAGKLCFIELVCGEGLVNLAENMSAFDNWCRQESISVVQASAHPVLAKFAGRNGWRAGNVSVYRRLGGVH